MGFSYYFRRTWVPGYNSEYIDPNLAYRSERRLQLAKKVVLWMFILMLLTCVIVLLVTLYTSTLPDCPGNQTLGQMTPLSQATAESRFQTLQPINLTDITDVDRIPASVSTSTENKVNDVYEEQPGLNESQDYGGHSLVFPEISTEAYHVEDMKTENVKLEETLVQSVTEESMNMEVESEKPKDFTELLNQHLLNPESDEGLAKRNMTTREDGSSSTQRLQPDTGCGPTDFRCNSTQKCIPFERICDGRFDCAQPLETVISSEIDRSDEMGCVCKPESFVCEKKTTSPLECIHMHLVCDSFEDCRNGKDEAVCTAVSETLTKVSLNDKRKTEIKGYVLVRVRGSWHPYCKKNWSTDLGTKICKFFGYPKLVEMHTIGLHDLNRRVGVNLSSRGKSAEELDRTEKSPLWLLNGSDDYLAVTGGPIEDVVTEATEDNEYDCTVAHILCSNFNTTSVSLN